MSNRAIPQAAIDLVRRFEETHLFAYDDKHYPPHPAQPGDTIDGTLTAGTGHTGPDVAIGMVVTAMMDQDWLQQDLQTAATRAAKRIGDVVDDLTENQWATIIDFTFECGDGDPKKPEWTIWKRLRARDFDQVPHEIARFVNFGHPPQKSAGMVKRRNAETELWADGEPGTIVDKPPASITRCEPTPPTPTDPVPPGKSKGLIAGAVAGIAAVPAAIDQVGHVIAPYAQHSQFIERAIGVGFTIAGACAAISWIYMYLQKKNARN